jgi:hypothetical protein
MCLIRLSPLPWLTFPPNPLLWFTQLSFPFIRSFKHIADDGFNNSQMSDQMAMELTAQRLPLFSGALFCLSAELVWCLVQCYVRMAQLSLLADSASLRHQSAAPHHSDTASLRRRAASASIAWSHTVALRCTTLRTPPRRDDLRCPVMQTTVLHRTVFHPSLHIGTPHRIGLHTALLHTATYCNALQCLVTPASRNGLHTALLCTALR